MKELLRHQKAQIILLQETKLKGVIDNIVKEIGGMRNVKWKGEAVHAIGAAGGLL